MSEESITLIVDAPRFRFTLEIKDACGIALLTNETIGDAARELLSSLLEKDVYLGIMSIAAGLRDIEIGKQCSHVRAIYECAMEHLCEKARDMP